MHMKLKWQLWMANFVYTCWIVHAKLNWLSRSNLSRIWGFRDSWCSQVIHPANEKHALADNVQYFFTFLNYIVADWFLEFWTNGVELEWKIQATHTPLMLSFISSNPVTTPLPLRVFYGLSAPFSSPLMLRSHAVAVSEENKHTIQLHNDTL